jgi:hypothetical protein
VKQGEKMACLDIAEGGKDGLSEYCAIYQQWKVG